MNSIPERVTFNFVYSSASKIHIYNQIFLELEE